MKKMLLPVLLAVGAATLIIVKPEICSSGAAEGILLCGRVIIPSLFPLTVCTLFITECMRCPTGGRFNRAVKRLFHLSADELLIVALSLLGGYPIGARLLNDAVEKGRISPEKAGIMLCYCVNSGPAFSVLAIGVGIYSSKTVGLLLLTAHLLPSVLMCLLTAPFTKSSSPPKAAVKCPTAADCFVSAVASAAGTVTSICGWVILFSVVGEYTDCFSAQMPALRFLGCLLEVTNAAARTRSLPFTAFLLGFAGLAVWCQILSIARRVKINFALFLLSRCLHGALSALLLMLLLKIFKISVTASATPVFVPTSDGLAVMLSALITATVFVISVTTEKNTGKFLSDVV